jgi:hypothetical protein
VFIDALLFMDGLGLLLFCVAGIVVPIWLFRLVYAKRWKRAGILVSVATVALLVLIGMAALDRERKRSSYLSGLFATKVTLPPPIFEYDPPRTWLGDGFSLTIYALPESVRQRFLAADQRLLTSHPQPGINSGLIIRTWTTEPLDDESGKAMEFLLSFPEAHLADLMQQHVTTIRERIGNPKTYYAYFMEKSDEYITNVDWFIVDLEADRLYFINGNT